MKLPLLNEKTITLFKKLSNSLSNSNRALGFLGQRVADNFLIWLREQGDGGIGRAERRDESEEGEEAERHGVAPLEPRKPPMVAIIRRSAARSRSS